MKLNLGCGYRKYEDFTNVDFDPQCEPDVVCDFEHDNLPFEDNSVEEVELRHVLEHLGDGFFHLLQEVYRVCRPGAIVHIVVPHHRHEHFFNDPTHKRPITVEGMRMFSKAFNKYCIEIGDGTSKLGLHYNVDFDLLDQKFIFDGMYQPLIEQVHKTKDPELEKYIQTLIREKNNVINEVEILLVVVK